MNKLISKIVGVALGLSLAVGTGVAICANTSATRAEAAAGDTPTGNWEAVSSISDISAGQDYLLGYVASDVAYYSKSTSLTSNNLLTSSTLSEAKIVRFVAVTGGWNIQIASSTYLGYGSSSTNLATNSNGGTGAKYVWVANLSDDGTVYFTTNNNGRFLGAVSSSANQNIRGYSTQNLSTYPLITAFKAATSGTSITAITSISGTPTAKVGGSWDLTTLTAKGTLNGNANSDITNYVDFSTNTAVPSSAGSTTVRVTASLKTGVSGGAQSFSDDLTGTVTVEALINSNLNSLTWDTTSYATSPHMATYNTNYNWTISAGQLNSNVAYLGSNSATQVEVSGNNSWTLKDTSINTAIENDNDAAWYTYGAALYMSNFGIVHPTSFSVTAGTVGNLGNDRAWYILSSSDSGDSWSVLNSGTDIQANTAMSWTGNDFSSNSNPIAFALVITYSGLKTMSNINVVAYGDSLANTKVLSSIYLSGTPTKTYVVGQSFDLGTAKVYARYTNQNEYPDEDISNLVTWTAIAHGTTEVTGTYAGQTVTVDGLTVTDEGSVFKKVLNTSELIDGAKIVLGTSDGSLTAGVQNNNNRSAEAAGGEFEYYEGGDIINYSVRTTIFTIGITENGYTFYDENANGYLYASSSSDNYLRTRASIGEDGCAEWAISISNGLATVVDQGTNSRNTMNGYSTGFGAYDATKDTFTLALSLYADVEGSLEGFAENYLHMSEYNTNSGWCKDSEHHYYLTAKQTLVGMGADYISEFQTNSSLASALARYNAWADACGDTDPFTGTTINLAHNMQFAHMNNSALMIVIVTAFVTTTFVGGYFFLRKKKEN